MEWEVTPENISFQAVKFLVYIFKEGEIHDIRQTNNIISLTGETELFIPKKSMHSGDSLLIIAVSKNNNLSSPVSIKL